MLSIPVRPPVADHPNIPMNRRILHHAFQALAAAILLATSSAAIPERPEPDMLFLENEAMKIGIDRSMGASITWLSWQAHPENIINIHDPGRLIQQSYYAGEKLDRRADGQHNAWSPWTWNPIQGGGVMSWARVTRFEILNDEKLISITVPKLWDMPDEEAEALMVQSTEFEPGMPDVVRINNRLVCKRKPDDRWGAAVPRHQELPACYFTSAFRHVESYLGNGEWRREEQPPGPPWGRATPPLNVMACFNDDGQGIAVFSPAATDHWNFGPHRRYTPRAKPEDGPCVHLAPIATVRLGPESTLEYRYWMVVGSKVEITKRIDILLNRHRSEEFSLK
jgi:hypothetical protein